MRRVELQAMTEIAHIADGCTDMYERADAVAHALHPLIPFCGSWIAVVDPVHAEHETLRAEGYSSATEAYARSSAVLGDIELVGANRSAAPMTMHGLPVAADDVPVWRDYLVPEGFREALVAGLFSGNRYVGIMTLQTDDPAHPTEEALDLVRLLSPMIGRTLDPLAGVGTTALLMHQARAGIILTRDGRSGPLPGLLTHPQLLDGSPLRGVVDAVVARGTSETTFLSPDREWRFVRVTVVPCDSTAPFHVAAAVVLSGPCDLHGLDSVDLALLGLLGAPADADAAVAVAGAHRLIQDRMPHIAATLHARTREQAVARAVRLGLLVPPALAGSLLPCGRS
jgi:hypothetical protein